VGVSPIKEIMVKKINAQNGKRLTDKEKEEALFLYHLYDGNASAVARDLGTTTKTIRNIAVKENFDGKRVLIQDKLNRVLTATDDPNIAKLLEADLKVLTIATNMLDIVERDIKRKRIRPRNMVEAITVLKFIVDLRKSLLGDASPEESSVRRHANGIVIENFNVLEMDPDKQKDVMKVLAERAALIG